MPFGLGIIELKCLKSIVDRQKVKKISNCNWLNMVKMNWLHPTTNSKFPPPRFKTAMTTRAHEANKKDSNLYDNFIIKHLNYLVNPTLSNFFLPKSNCSPHFRNSFSIYYHKQWRAASPSSESHSIVFDWVQNCSLCTSFDYKLIKKVK